jgi:predicted DNA-binding transcriptional regulator
MSVRSAVSTILYPDIFITPNWGANLFAYLDNNVFKLFSEWENVIRMRAGNLIAGISELLNIRATSREILEILTRSRGKLLVSEIITHSKRSERAVRTHLKLLLQLHLIRREGVITKKGKLAYRYLALRTHELIKSTKEEMLRRLHRLEAHM